MPELFVKQRRTAVISDGKNEVQIVSCEPGDKIFDIRGEKEIFLGIVMNGKPVINGLTAYLSTDDYDRAKAAIPATGRRQ